ncbi:ROK family protein [Alsobacter sp. R-9]
MTISGCMTETPSSSLLRQNSLRAVFEVMLDRGPISRAELARVTGLSKQTASEVVRDLESGGWIRPTGQTHGSVGRSATTFELQENRAFVLGADLGGTKVHVALANLLGAIVGQSTEPTDPRGGEHVVRQIKSMMLEIARTAGVDPSRVRYGAIGSPGVFDPDTGHIDIAPNIPGLDRIDVREALQEALGCPVAVENDVNLAALGERWRGCARDVKSFVFVALGTGVGMGIVADGRLVRGARGAAGEIAYLPLGSDPFDARGYRLGTFESAVGSVSIAERYRAMGGDPALDVRGIFDRIAAGDAAAEATIDEVARLMTQAIMAIKALLDPELVVLGGSIGCRPELVARIQALATRFVGPSPKIAASALGSGSTLMGALEMGLGWLHASFPGHGASGNGAMHISEA